MPRISRLTTLSALVAALPLLLSACGGSSSSGPLQVCQETATPFQAAYAAASAVPGATDSVSIDLTHHEYTFKPLAAMTLCSVGYQADANLVNSTPTIANPYLIELIDTSTSATLYAGSHSFTTTATSYVALPTPIVLTAGNTYLLRRTVNNYNGNIVNTVGRLVNPVQLPLVVPGSIEITGSNFYGTGGPIIDQMLPFIDFGTL